MDILWNELDKEESESLNHRVARKFLAGAAEDFAQDPRHIPTTTFDSTTGNYQTTCSCGVASTPVNKDTVQIDPDYLDPENTFTEQEIEDARHNAAKRATMSEFGAHARDFQEDDSFIEAMNPETIDLRHSDELSDTLRQHDLQKLLEETGGRPTGKEPEATLTPAPKKVWKPSERPHINEAGDEVFGTYEELAHQDRRGINRPDVIKKKLDSGVEKIKQQIVEPKGLEREDFSHGEGPVDNLLRAVERQKEQPF